MCKKLLVYMNHLPRPGRIPQEILGTHLWWGVKTDLGFLGELPSASDSGKPSAFHRMFQSQEYWEVIWKIYVGHEQ